MRHLLMFAILAPVISASQASSPDAWKDLYRTTGTACLQKSGLKNPKVIEGPTVFSHAVLYKIRGTWPQPHMKGKPGRVYCLHAYPHGEPEIVESR
jgi:hypothetical protein